MNITDTELYQAMAALVRRLRTARHPRNKLVFCPHTLHAIESAKPTELIHYCAIATALGTSPGTLLDLAIAEARDTPTAQYRNSKPHKPSP